MFKSIIAFMLAAVALAGCGTMSDNLLPAEKFTRGATYTEGFHMGRNMVTNTLELTMGTNIVLYEGIPVYATDGDGKFLQLGSELWSVDPETDARTLLRRDMFGSCSDFGGDTSAGLDGGAVFAAQGNGTGPGIVSCRQYIADDAPTDENTSP